MIALAAIALVILMASPFQHPKDRYKDRNPVVIVHATEQEARSAALADAAKLKGNHYLTSGTGSMEPLLTGRVYVVGVAKPYDQLQQGEIANYRAKFADGGIVVHRLVQKDKGGWIGSGDNNRWSESNERIKPSNYIDTVVRVHTYKGAEKTRVKK